MRSKLFVSLFGVAALAVVVTVAAFAATRTSTSTPMSGMHTQAHASAAALTKSDLRVLLDKQLGEHAVLAMNATNLGVKGSPAFAAAAKALDQNSVALSKSIAAVYGAKAGKTFLNGAFMWRAHVKFFVDYTVGVAKKDAMAQSKAVTNLKTYTVKFGDFLATATGLPKLAVRNDLLGHVLELKGQLDAYAAGNYGLAATKYRAAYAHMIMTGDLLAGAIAKQQNLR